LEVTREAHIALTAPRIGNLAGLLLTGRGPDGADQRYHFGSAHASVLTGTIYLPNGRFSVGSGVTIADRSPFTSSWRSITRCKRNRNSAAKAKPESCSPADADVWNTR